ncbi:ATP-binding cassette domain-containing protein [Candidatus Saccharibacteria bacterium]|nr:ATP-binding cassette domain-containing protein [Candidatus Saccharibacteria bacterium]
MSEKTVIKIDSVVKDFHLPHHSSDSIKTTVIQAFKKKDKAVDIHHALKGVSFEIKEGEFFGILGRNGSGKSTLLKILAKIYTPTSGSATYKGKLIPFIELGVGFKPDLTGRENVYLNGALLGFSRKEIDERYDEIVAFSELEEFMDQKLKNYSSGMKVRLAFSVATHAQADILLLDEVLAVGDASFQRKCYDYFKSLKDQKKTVVFVTHSMGLARQYCDRAILIEEGEITHQGDVEEVAEAYTNIFNNRSNNSVSTEDGLTTDGSAEFSVNDASISREFINLELTLRANEDITDAFIGVRFTRDKKQNFAGFDTFRTTGKYFNLGKGEQRVFKFRLKNRIGLKNFSVGLSLRSDKGEVIRINWRDAYSFINPAPETRFPVMLEPENMSKSKP